MLLLDQLGHTEVLCVSEFPVLVCFIAECHVSGQPWCEVGGHVWCPQSVAPTPNPERKIHQVSWSLICWETQCGCAVVLRVHECLAGPAVLRHGLPCREPWHIGSLGHICSRLGRKRRFQH